MEHEVDNTALTIFEDSYSRYFSVYKSLENNKLTKMKQPYFDDLTLGQILSDYPDDGIQVAITFSKEDLITILAAYLTIEDKTGILGRIIYEVTTAKSQLIQNKRKPPETSLPKNIPLYKVIRGNMNKIKPLYKCDSFGRPLGIDIDKPTHKYAWLEKGVTADEPEGWYYIDNSEGEPAYPVFSITVADNDDWKTNSADYRS